MGLFDAIKGAGAGIVGGPMGAQLGGLFGGAPADSRGGMLGGAMAGGATGFSMGGPIGGAIGAGGGALMGGYMAHQRGKAADAQKKNMEAARQQLLAMSAQNYQQRMKDLDRAMGYFKPVDGYLQKRYGGG